MLTRSEILLRPVPRGGRVIEIGPSFSPIAPKAEGWNTVTLDHTTREGLVEKYRGHQGVNVGRIEEVDVVWTSGPLSDAVDRALHGTFDAFVASHVIEHTPDMLAFLDSAATLLKQDGVVVLAVPDKRYCFDYFQPLTTIGQILAASSERRSRHSPRLAFDFAAYYVEDGGLGAWGQWPSRGLRLIHSVEDARDLAAKVRADEYYVDIHAWRFTPASFELLLLDLARLGKTDWRVERTTPAENCEFFAWLRRGGMAAVASLPAADFSARRLDLLKRTLLETRAQIDWLLAGEPGLAAAPPALLPVTSQPPAPAAPVAMAPVAAPAPAPSGPPQAEPTNSHYVDWFPTPENAARAFEGEWSSAVPGLPTGHARLFEDGRILWFEERLGDFHGLDVLELGPLEGGHTHMMTQRGATVLAIESNRRAWMRCLAVKQAVGGMPEATFLLGDFVKYVQATPRRFDFVLASGVLYHMTDPVGLLHGLSAMSDAIGLWTHYFEPGMLERREDLRQKFSLSPRVVTTPRGRKVHFHDQRYLGALEWSGFCGGAAPGSSWMPREDILGVLQDEGFVCETAFDDRDHPNGPAFCVFARRPAGAGTGRAGRG